MGLPFTFLKETAKDISMSQNWGTLKFTGHYENRIVPDGVATCPAWHGQA